MCFMFLESFTKGGGVWSNLDILFVLVSSLGIITFPFSCSSFGFIMKFLV